MGDYWSEALTTGWEYPRFTRSPAPWTVSAGCDAGSQGDHPYEIEPDKGGIAGYAWCSVRASASASI